MYLALQLHPGVLGLGLQLPLLVLLDALQEALSALRVLHMLDTHVNSLGQDLAPLKEEKIEEELTGEV